MYRSFAVVLPFLLLLSSPLAAWQVEVAPGGEGREGEEWVWVANEQQGLAADAYLVWTDLDQPFSLSWRFRGGWQEGIYPVADQPLQLDPFVATALAELPASCETGHRCLLVMVANTPGAEATDTAAWLHSSVLPLSPEARLGRWPGQSLFSVSVDSDSSSRFEPTPAPTAAEDGAVGDSAGASSSGATPAETEKPDLFRREGDRLLYANGAAERFQVIDVSDPASPHIAGSLAMKGAPREVYAIDGRYVLLEGRGWGSDSGTRMVTIASDDQGLTVVGELEIEGHFVESRRREGRIYVVTEEYSEETMRSEVTIHPVSIDSDGQPVAATPATFAGYSARIAIFPDHLVVAASSSSDWRDSMVQLYSLADPDSPLVAYPLLKIDGRIPTEFHLDVTDDQLRVVHGPADRREGSSLSIYAIGSDELNLLGQVGDIAPGEDLFATRFVGQTAYVVTYERTDPLWVIDLTVPTSPVIVGELKVPGWSELLFFNNQRLLGVGIDDQPDKGELIDGSPVEWARRVAVSLFDVSEPTNPTLIERFTPLVGVAAYSYSPAIDDERALRIDWQSGEVALPISHWQESSNHMLQLVTINDDGLDNGGQLKTDKPVQRSLALDGEHLAALGDQALYTARREEDRLTLVGEIELARSLNWLYLNGESIYASGYGENGLDRLYRLADGGGEEQVWKLGQGYYQVVTSDDKLLFYRDQPLEGELVDLETGQVTVLAASEKVDDGAGWRHHPLFSGRSLYMTRTEYHYDDAPKPEPFPEPKPEPEPDMPEKPPVGEVVDGDDASTDNSSGASAGSDDGEPLSGEGALPLDERELSDYTTSPDYSPEPVIYRESITTTLVGWRLDNGLLLPYPERSIPGEAVAVSDESIVHTLEWLDGGLWLHRLRLAGDEALLLGSVRVDGCSSQHSRSQVAGGVLWLSCSDYGDDGVVKSQLSAYRLDGEPQLVQRWPLDGDWQLIEVAEGVALVGGGYATMPYYGEPMPVDGGVAVAAVDIGVDMIWMPPKCGVVDLASGELRELELDGNGCSDPGSVELTSDTLLQARGFAGVKRWPLVAGE